MRKKVMFIIVTTIVFMFLPNIVKAEKISKTCSYRLKVQNTMKIEDLTFKFEIDTDSSLVNITYPIGDGQKKNDIIWTYDKDSFAINGLLIQGLIENSNLCPSLSYLGNKKENPSSIQIVHSQRQKCSSNPDCLSLTRLEDPVKPDGSTNDSGNEQIKTMCLYGAASNAVNGLSLSAPSIIVKIYSTNDKSNYMDVNGSFDRVFPAGATNVHGHYGVDESFNVSTQGTIFAVKEGKEKEIFSSQKSDGTYSCPAQLYIIKDGVRFLISASDPGGARTVLKKDYIEVDPFAPSDYPFEYEGGIDCAALAEINDWLQEVLSFIQLGVIVIVIVQSIIEYTKIIMLSDADAMKKANIKTIKRIIVVAAILLVGPIMSLIFNLFTEGNLDTCGLV